MLSLLRVTQAHGCKHCHLVCHHRCMDAITSQPCLPPEPQSQLLLSSPCSQTTQDTFSSPRSTSAVYASPSTSASSSSSVSPTTGSIPSSGTVSPTRIPVGKRPSSTPSPVGALSSRANLSPTSYSSPNMTADLGTEREKNKKKLIGKSAKKGDSRKQSTLVAPDEEASLKYGNLKIPFLLYIIP